MVESSTERYVGGAYLGANPEWHEDRATWKANQVRKILTANGVVPRSLLDVGCGTGGILERLASTLDLERAVGYDVSEAAIGLAGEARREQISLHAGDVRSLQDHFDAVLVLDVIEHVEDYFGFLRSIRHLGDAFVFHVPLALNVAAVARMKPIMHARDQVGHIHCFSRETALATLTENGYVIIDDDYTVASLEARPADPLGRRLVRLPRRAAFRLAPDLACRWLGGTSVMILARPAG